MNHAPAAVPQVRRADSAPRVAGEPSLFSARLEVPREALEDAELFQSLVAPSMGETWAMPCGFAGGGGDSDGFAGDPPPAAAQTGATGRSLGAWETLVQRLDEQLTGWVGDTLEATFELPNLGAVSVQVLTQAKTLDITVRFAQSEALQLCQRGREASRERLSQRLGRRVNLTLDMETR